jgi:hypothetical protein
MKQGERHCHGIVTADAMGWLKSGGWAYWPTADSGGGYEHEGHNNVARLGAFVWR